MSLFIVIEAIDRAGKTTQLDAVADALREAGISLALTAYPDETAPLTGQLITAFRHGEIALVADPVGDQQVNMLLGQALFSLNRREKAEHLERLLKRHQVVISSRYRLSGLAYAEAIGLSPADVAAMQSALESDLRQPDLTLVLDLDPDNVLNRPRAKLDAFERNLALQRGVRRAYHRLAEEDPLVRLVDASGQPEEVTTRLLRELRVLPLLARALAA